MTLPLSALPPGRYWTTADHLLIAAEIIVELAKSYGEWQAADHLLMRMDQLLYTTGASEERDEFILIVEKFQSAWEKLHERNVQRPGDGEA